MSRKSRRNQPQSSLPDNNLTSPASKPLVNNPNPGEESRKLLQISGHQEFLQVHAGPLPSPHILREYNEIIPGLAGRIVAQAERQTEHRASLESIVVRSDNRKSWAGLACGFLLCLTCIGAGTTCVLYGHDWAGTTIATAAVGGLAATFIYGTTVRKAERTEKTKILTGQK